MHEFAINALILAEPGRIRDGLYALLSAVDRDLQPLTAESPAHALELCLQRKVGLILIDANFIAGDLKEFVARLGRISPGIIRVVIVHSLRARERALKAEADMILTPSYTSERFFDVVKSLIRNRVRADKYAEPGETQISVSPEAARKLKNLVEMAGAAPCSERGQSMNLLLSSQKDEVMPRSTEPNLPQQDLSGYYAERLQAIAELLLQLSRSSQNLKLKLAGLKQAEEQFARLIAIYQENNIDTDEIQAILNRLKEISAGHLEEGNSEESQSADERRFTYPPRPLSNN